MINKTKRIGKGHFRQADGTEIQYAPVEGEVFTWEQVSYQTVLTKEEKKKAKALGYDLKKVLKVKACLERQMRPMEIHRSTKIARSSIDNYRKILSEKDMKLQEKDVQTTKKLDCVFFNLLVCSDLVGETTFYLFLILVLLFIIIIVACYFHLKWEQKQQAYQAHHKEADRLRKLMYKVMDFSFRRYPIVCSTEAEKRYYEKLLKHYNNQGRKVELIEPKLNQNAHYHQAIKAEFARNYIARNKDMVVIGDLNAEQYWEKLILEGLLDYLKNPKGENWEASKAYIEDVTNYLIENPRPTVTDQAKRKLVLEVMPSSRIGS